MGMRLVQWQVGETETHLMTYEGYGFDHTAPLISDTMSYVLRSIGVRQHQRDQIAALC